MKSLPKTRRRRAISTITVRDLEGRVWAGDGDGLAAAVRDLGERHAAAQAVVQYVTLTPLGVLALTEADLRAVHPAACRGCPTCRTILPRLLRTLTSAAATSQETHE